MSIGRLLALDFGTKRVGAAVSDRQRSIASPLEVYRRVNPAQDAAHYRAIVAAEEIEQLVVGLPVRSRGEEGASATAARDFGRWIAAATGRPVVFYDERFTTADAEEILLEHGVKSKGRAAKRDMLAAQILLTHYLEAGCPQSERPALPLEDNAGGTERSA